MTRPLSHDKRSSRRTSVSGRSAIVLLILGLVALSILIPYVHVAPESLNQNHERIIAPHSDSSLGNRVIIGFWGSERLRAHQVSQENAATLVQEDDILQFAVYRPTDKDAFLRSMRNDPSVRYVEEDVLTSVMASPDFSITANPGSITLPGASNRTSTLTLTSLNSFSGTVSISAAVTPSVTNQPTTTVVPSSVSLGANASVNSTLTIFTTNTGNRTYIITVTATSGSLIHSISVTVTVPFPNDPLLSQQWGVPDLNLVPAWQKTVGTKKIIVAVIDTGVWANHPEISGNLWTAPDGSHGWNCFTNTTNSTDDFGHGTLVSGVIAASINNGVGVAGTVQAQIMAVKTQNSTGFGTAATLACGVRWAANHGANVISMSVGGPFSIAEQDAVAYAWSKGALIVAAAGNQSCGGIGRQTVTQIGCSDVVCPACFNEVIAVSALTTNDALAAFSDFGPKVELTAPGSNILTINWPANLGLSCHGQLYCSYSGTSLSTPFVSGVAALGWDYGLQLGGTFSNQMIRDALDKSVVHLGTAGRNSQFGFGKPDALALLSTVGASIGPNFNLATNPGNLTFTPAKSASARSTLTLTSVNGFSGSVNLNTTVSNGPPGTCPGAKCPVASLSGTTLSLTSGSSATSTLTVSVASNTPTGNYTITVTGISGSLSRSVWIYARLPDFAINVGYLTSTSRIAQGVTVPYADLTLLSQFGFNGLVNVNTTVSPSLTNGLAASTSLTTSFLPIDLFNTTRLTVSSASNTPTGSYTVNVTFTGGSVSHSSLFTLIVMPPGFSLSPSTFSFYVAPGGSTNVALQLGSQFNFVGTVSLTATFSPIVSNGPTVSLAPANVMLRSGGINSSTLTVSAASNTPQQTYSVSVTGRSGTLTNSIVLTAIVAVPDFQVGSAGTITIQNGETSHQVGINVVSVNGFSGTVTLSATVSPGVSNGPTVTLNPYSTNLVPYNSQFIVMTISSPNSPAMNFTVTVTGTSGSLTRQGLSTVVISDIIISINPDPVTTNVGSPTSASVQITGVNGYGNFGVVLSIASGLPSCVTATLNPTTFTIIANNPSYRTGLSNIALTVGSNCNPSSYTVSVAATTSNPSITRLQTFTLTITDFSLSSGSPNAWVAQGSNGTVTLTLQSLGGFSDIVSFSVSGLPTGTSYSFNPTYVFLDPSGPQPTALVISATSSAQIKSYSITIVASNGFVSHSVPLTLKVLPATETIPSTGQPFNIYGPNATPSGSVNATVSGTFTINTSLSRTLTGAVSLNAYNGTTGANIYSLQYNITLPFGEFNNGLVMMVLEIPSTPLWTSVNCRVDVTLQTFSIPNCFLTRTLDISHHGGTVGIIDVGVVQYAYGSTPGSPKWDPRADLDASGVVGFIDFTIEQGWFGANLYLPVASASSTPAGVTVVTGSSGSSTIVFQSTGGFVGTLALTQASLPSGLSCALTPASVTLASGGNATSTLACATGTAHWGNYTITITGTKGTLRTSTFVIFRVTDFSLTASPTTLTIQKGNSASSTMSLASLNGFSGSVTLTANVSPVNNAVPTTSFQPATLTIISGGSGNSALTISTFQNTTKGTYTITVNATSGSAVHTFTIMVTITS